MNDLLSAMHIGSLEVLLNAYAQANGGVNDFDIIDGGAGAGTISRRMLKTLHPSRNIYAFEPFPGNHKFFRPEENQIKLIKKALAETTCRRTLKVHSVVSKDSPWGKEGYEGYSSIGYLSKGSSPQGLDVEVECTRADDELHPDSDIGFIKLDLQGGELNALHGMSETLKQVKLMWIEFTDQPGLLDYLANAGFLVFDTEYFIMGEPTKSALQIFDVSKTNVVLSTGRLAWFGFRKHTWENYRQTFSTVRRQHQVSQTDVVCVNKKYLPEFINALQYINLGELEQPSTSTPGSD